MRYAHVKDGQVVNVSVWPDDAEVPSTDEFGAELVRVEAGLGVGPGWNYDGLVFSPPTIEAPS